MLYIKKPNTLQNKLKNLQDSVVTNLFDTTTFKKCKKIKTHKKHKTGMTSYSNYYMYQQIYES